MSNLSGESKVALGLLVGGAIAYVAYQNRNRINRNRLAQQVRNLKERIRKCQI